jgi:hypothetical protein
MVFMGDDGVPLPMVRKNIRDKPDYNGKRRFRLVSTWTGIGTQRRLPGPGNSSGFEHQETGK